MLTIARLFGKSPFAPLQTHMGKVASCVGKLPSLFRAVISNNLVSVEAITTEISTFEHEADLTKNDIRSHLPKSLFLPVDRGALLEILALQDSLADQAESIAHLAALRTLSLPLFSETAFALLCQKSLESFWLVRDVIKELDGLLESSFGGIEAEKVKAMIDQIAFLEYETNVQKRHLLKALYQTIDEIHYPLFHLAIQFIEQIGWLACLSEKLGNRVRMLLELT